MAYDPRDYGFQYGDRVEIISGYHAGTEATVTDPGQYAKQHSDGEVNVQIDGKNYSLDKYPGNGHFIDHEHLALLSVLLSGSEDCDRPDFQPGDRVVSTNQKSPFFGRVGTVIDRKSQIEGGTTVRWDGYTRYCGNDDCHSTETDALAKLLIETEPQQWLTVGDAVICVCCGAQGTIQSIANGMAFVEFDDPNTCDCSRPLEDLELAVSRPVPGSFTDNENPAEEDMKNRNLVHYHVGAVLVATNEPGGGDPSSVVVPLTIRTFTSQAAAISWVRSQIPVEVMELQDRSVNITANEIGPYDSISTYGNPGE